MFFNDIFRTIVAFFLLFLVISMFLLFRAIISQLRSVVEELREAIRILKEIRDHQKGIRRIKIRKEGNSER